MSHRAAVAAVIAGLGILTSCASAGEQQGGTPAAPTMPAGGSASSDAVTGVAPEFGPPQAPPPVQKRDVVKTASMTVTVPDPSAAADEAAVIAERNDGRVDSRSEDAGSSGGRAVTSIVLRVPADDLDEVLRQLKALGTVETATTTAEDVTTQRVDLDARIRALQTSVDRLLAIMSEARDPEALIQAESALSQRQADLDSLRAQREALGDRIAYSTIEASFHAEQIGGPAPERYEGFLGQVERGWDGLVAVAGGAVLLLGLLLPWLGVLLVVGLVIFGLVRATQRRPAPVAAPAPTEPTDQPDAVERDG